MKPAIIRGALVADAEFIEAIAVLTEMFPVEEAGFLGELLAEAGSGTQVDARWLVAEQPEGVVVAAAYYAPEPHADRMWNLYFISVTPSVQGQGVGKQLMAHVEASLRARGDEVARTLIVETSSTAQYENTRAFYQRIGYVEEARIRQFYGPKDDKVVFWKAF